MDAQIDSNDLATTTLKGLIQKSCKRLREESRVAKVLIIGGNGFIGSSLKPWLENIFSANGLDYGIYIVGKKDLQAVESWIDDCKLFVVDMGTSSRPRGPEEMPNGEHSKHQMMKHELLLRLARDRDCRITFLSSGCVKGRNRLTAGRDAMRTPDEIYLDDMYLFEKLADEYFANQLAGFCNAKISIIRLYSVILPNQLSRPHLAVSTFIERAHIGRRINVSSPNTLRSYIGVEELGCNLLLAMCEERKLSIFSAGSPLTVNMLKIAQAASLHYGGKSIVSAEEEYGKSENSSWYYPEVDELHRDLQQVTRKKTGLDEIQDLLSEVII